MTKPVEGIIAMLVTPFDDQYRLDEGALRAEVDWCVAQGPTASSPPLPSGSLSI
jgi:dihydrodipicolinate synthase/N-acetylneuraminate lyase